MPDAHRKIIHVDMDAFYASVEQRDDPSLRGRPVAVGGTSRRGVVAAASYESRVYGVHSAMPTAVALRKCPDLLLVRPRFDVYREISRHIRSIFARYTDLIEPLSLDEAYLDVTEPRTGPPSATLIAQRIREEILEETGLTASAGVSFNKFLAKLASDQDKPDGLTVILPDDAHAFISALPIERFFGVGPARAEKMKRLGIHTGADLREWSEPDLREHFGKAGGHFYRIARAVDNRSVNPDRERKSVGAERTFSDDLATTEQMAGMLEEIARKVAQRLEKSRLCGHTVTLKIKYLDFEVTSRSMTLTLPVRSRKDIFLAGRLLLDDPAPPDRPVRLLGLTVGRLAPRIGDDTPAGRQLELPLEGLAADKPGQAARTDDGRQPVDTH